MTIRVYAINKFIPGTPEEESHLRTHVERAVNQNYEYIYNAIGAPRNFKWIVVYGFHGSQSEQRLHWTVRAFGGKNTSSLTLHVFENEKADVFANGGRYSGGIKKKSYRQLQA